LASKPTNLPGSTQARLLLSVDASLFDIPNSEIAGWLRDANYTVINQAATVANLKQVQGDGVFFWITHGSYAVDPAAHVSVWTLWTADAVTDANNAAFKDDLDDHSLVYFTANNEFDPVTKKFTARTHYAITDNFVTKYQWSFADYPFIFVDACHSDQYGMANSLMARASKVGTSFGWSDTVYTDAAARAPRFAFDRLLGNSKAAPAPSTAQRPFDGSAVFRELHAVGADTSTANATVIVARSGAPPALRPSIMRMEVTERLSESPLHGPTKLTLYGIFGDAQGTVKVGGVELPIQSWATDKIVATPADLPGPGFSGLVQVISNSRESNAVELTQWHGQLKYQITPYPPQSTSTAVSHIDCDVYFRGDLHPYRDDAGADLLDPDP
ncbi:MAG: hypothetical protein JST92_26005, partial [Deltaproteobacteria bacterium]|nr:hypothetical protein [Deltaproteobacteria bacterium]